MSIKKILREFAKEFFKVVCLSCLLSVQLQLFLDHPKLIFYIPLLHNVSISDDATGDLHFVNFPQLQHHLPLLLHCVWILLFLLDFPTKIFLFDVDVNIAPQNKFFRSLQFCILWFFNEIDKVLLNFLKAWLFVHGIFLLLH